MAGILENGQVTIRFVAPTSIISNQPAFVKDTVSLKRQTNSQGVQRWEIKTNLEPSNYSTDFLIHSVTNGYDQIFDIQVPQVYRLRDKNATTTTSIITASANAVSNTSSIYIQGNNGSLSKGEFIKFSNHDKIYILTSNRIGNGTINIYPPLLTDVSIGTGISYGANTTMKVRYDTDAVLGITFTDGILSDPGSITLIESF